MKFIKNRKSIITISLLGILIVSTFLGLLPNLTLMSMNAREQNPIEENFSPLSSQVGEDAWWNASYRWRQCINITNPGDYNLTDNWIKINAGIQEFIYDGDDKKNVITKAEKDYRTPAKYRIKLKKGDNIIRIQHRVYKLDTLVKIDGL